MRSRKTVRWFPSVALLCALGGNMACDSGPLPSPRRSTGPTPSLTVNISVSGTVRDETGAPIDRALVGVQTYSFYEDGFVWQTARTDAAGRYEVVAEQFGGPGEWTLARASVDGDTYEPTSQIVPLTGSVGTRDFRLRPVRHTTSDEPAAVSIDAESGLCVEADQPVNTQTRCETVRITATRGGLIVVDVRPAEAGGVIPTVALNGLQSVLPGRVSGLVQAGQTSRIRIQVPAGTPPGQYLVSASFQ